ncbi:hypothetical protein PVK06_009137 [Gossypium arboreum]|uniref:Uncharacterized protein n=1 Tax=Gossypium arboreum TaxID=29729 RepID=A0ABR0QN32_GOSAR|nr:hypothetical protein PVK06_009137 [Gossypium arboreum]
MNPSMPAKIERKRPTFTPFMPDSDRGKKLPTTGHKGMGVSDAWREHMPVVVREATIGWPSVLLRLEGYCCFLFSAGG